MADDPKPSDLDGVSNPTPERMADYFTQPDDGIMIETENGPLLLTEWLKLTESE